MKFPRLTFATHIKFNILLWIFINISQVNSLEKINITIDPDVVVREVDLIDCYERSNPTLKGEQQFVDVLISVLDVDQVNEDDMEFRIHCYFGMHWKNHYINITVPGPSRMVLLPRLLSKCMWKPDVIFPNTKEVTSFEDTLRNVGYKYTPEGYLYRVERHMFRIGCPMQFSLYPMDTQHCFFKISTLTSPDELVQLLWRPSKNKKKYGIFFSYDIQPLKFNVEAPKAHSVTMKWYTGNYTELWGNVTFHRRLTGSFINFYVPSTLVVVLSWLSFYIDVEAAPARVSLGVTSLLTITTQMVQARHILPPVQYITGLDIWLFACLSQVFASFIEYSIAYSFRHSFKRAAITPVKVFPKDTKCQCKKSASQTNRQESTPLITICNPFDKHSRWIFPCFMIVFTTVYWAYLLSATEIFRQ